MREALTQIRNELGENAVILKSNKIASGTFPFAHTDIEVTAAIEDSTAKPALPKESFSPLAMASSQPYTRPRTSCVIDSADRPDIKPWTPPASRSVIGQLASVRPPKNSDNEVIDELKQEIRDLVELVKATIPAKPEVASVAPEAIEPSLRAVYDKLASREVRHDTIVQLFDQMKNSPATSNVEERLLLSMQATFPVSGPIRCKAKGPKIVALVGPTGSGKTTTLAKLVANCRLSKEKRISIITADTYRIAAIDQIRTFADIVKVPLHVLFSADEVKQVIAECGDDDLVFIDTAGRSRRNTEQLAELRTLLGSLSPDEVHLVVSATTKDSDLLDTVETYRAIGADRLLFTKLDETNQLGNIVNTVVSTKMPVSFFTVGQSVPDDIELAHGAKFVRRFWEGVAS